MTPPLNTAPARTRQARPSPRTSHLRNFIPHAPFIVPSGHQDLGYRTRKVVPQNARTTASPRAQTRCASMYFPSLAPLTPRKVATSLRRRPLRGEMEDVVVSCEDHQHDDDRKSDPKAHLLSALRERFSPYGFDSIKQQVAAIEQRYRKQVEQADRNREHRREAEQRRKAFARHLPRHLGDPNWPAELIGRLATGDDPADVGQGALDDKPRPLHA